MSGKKGIEPINKPITQNDMAVIKYLIEQCGADINH